MKIRQYQNSDWHKLWPILKKVFREGETYTFSQDINEIEAQKIWIDTPTETYISIDEDDTILGTYYIKPNQPSLGSHVCNCGYIVSEKARGKGVASMMCEHSQQTALDLEFKSMQFNFVVATNISAIRLWEKLGFQVVGKLPGAFKSPSAGFVDALIMYKQLIENKI